MGFAADLLSLIVQDIEFVIDNSRINSEKVNWQIERQKKVLQKILKLLLKFNFNKKIMIKYRELKFIFR